MSGYLKDILFSSPIAHLTELKACIAQRILNVIQETLRSVMEMPFLDFNFLQKNGGQHIKHALHQSAIIYKPI